MKKIRSEAKLKGNRVLVCGLIMAKCLERERLRSYCPWVKQGEIDRNGCLLDTEIEKQKK